MAGTTRETTIRSLRDVAPGVRELTLAPPVERLSFLPGQWLSLHLPVGEHPPLVRAYTLVAPEAPGGELVLCFDRVPGGIGSEYLFGLEPGNPVVFAGPLGRFVLPETAGELLWLARHTGVVPFRAMLLYLAVRPEPLPRVRLVYSAPRPRDLAYREELEAAAARLPWFTLDLLVDGADSGWNGRVSTALDYAGTLSDCEPMVPMICGKREFVRPLRDYYYARGRDRRAVLWENFD